MNETVIAAIGMAILAFAGTLGEDTQKLPTAMAGEVAALAAR